LQNIAGVIPDAAKRRSGIGVPGSFLVGFPQNQRLVAPRSRLGAELSRGDGGSALPETLSQTLCKGLLNMRRVVRSLCFVAGDLYDFALAAFRSARDGLFFLGAFFFA